MDGAEACELLCLDVEKGEELRHALPQADELERRADAAKGLADPTRIALAVSLRDGGELCVCDLGWVTGRPEKLVSHHLRLMKTAGLVRSRKDGRRVMYALTPHAVRVLDALLAVGDEVAP
jgi:DNA-binding transcriptional ArsR family regulator